jgi:hypothetical protein
MEEDILMNSKEVGPCSPSLGGPSVNLWIHRESFEHPGLVLFLGRKSHPPPPEGRLSV